MKKLKIFVVEKVIAGKKVLDLNYRIGSGGWSFRIYDTNNEKNDLCYENMVGSTKEHLEKFGEHLMNKLKGYYYEKLTQDISVNEVLKMLISESSFDTVLLELMEFGNVLDRYSELQGNYIDTESKLMKARLMEYFVSLIKTKKANVS